MLRPHPTIKAALLVGFLMIFTAWLASTYYFTERLAEAQSQSAAIQAQFTRGQELLFGVGSQVLLGSIYVRDTLIEVNDPSTAAAVVSDQLRNLQAQVNQELGQYEAIDAVADAAAWRRLEVELREYWDAAVRLVAPESDDGTATAQQRLRTQVIPKRDVIVKLSDEIRQVMANAFTREQEELNETNRQVRRRIWATTAVAVIFGLGIAMVSTWYVRRLEATIREDHAEVVRNRQELQRLSGRLVRAQEDERRTIARELHDEIGQALTAVDVQLALTERSVGTNGRSAAALRDARSVTQRALSAVRDLSQLLRPTMLDDFGLPDTLKWCLRTFSDRTGVRTELIDDHLTERLPIDVEVCVYRTIQEALTNVSRYAQANACRVLIQRLPSSLIVTVEDDGRGFQSERDTADARCDGLGLVGIRERVADLGGTFRIEGEGGKGTRLTIEVPLAHTERA